MDSIISTKKQCYICGSPTVELHHIYHGTGNRKISDKNGFTVYLCPIHHRDSKYGVHFNKSIDMFLKVTCQMEYEKKHTREEFRKLIGKNYL